MDQSRALRDAAALSDVWSSEIQLTEDNIFHEAFFVNSALVSARLRVDHVYIDDTSCTNVFNLPLVSILCRDDCGTLHCLAWGITKNRTTSSFVRFLTFVWKFFMTSRPLCVIDIALKGTPSSMCSGNVSMSFIVVLMLPGISKPTPG